MAVPDLNVVRDLAAPYCKKTVLEPEFRIAPWFPVEGLTGVEALFSMSLCLFFPLACR